MEKTKKLKKKVVKEKPTKKAIKETPSKKTVKEKVVKKKTKKVNSGFTIEKEIEDVSESGKYSEKLSFLINKIKIQNENNPDVRIRFGWK